MPDDLILRPTIIDRETLPDDFEVIWNGLPIGRILKQPGIPAARPNWYWGVTFPGRPQPPGHRGNCSDLEECKRRFRVVWAGIRAGISEAAIGAARRIVDATDRRTVKWPER
jgi:hypothetical protein